MENRSLFLFSFYLHKMNAPQMTPVLSDLENKYCQSLEEIKRLTMIIGRLTIQLEKYREFIHPTSPFAQGGFQMYNLQMDGFPVRQTNHPRDDDDDSMPSLVSNVDDDDDSMPSLVSNVDDDDSMPSLVSDYDDTEIREAQDAYYSAMEKTVVNDVSNVTIREPIRYPLPLTRERYEDYFWDDAQDDDIVVMVPSK